MEPNPMLRKAFEWVEHPSGEGILSSDEHCPTRDTFLARLDRARAELEGGQSSSTALFIAILGEIGNNAYDHNLGNWRNIPGTYFAFDAEKGISVVADRGQGVRKTLSRVEPDLRSDRDALQVAFTKLVSGRSPERRGNGLKFVREVVRAQKWNLQFYSGTGKAMMTKGAEIEFSEADRNVKGCIVFISI